MPVQVLAHALHNDIGFLQLHPCQQQHKLLAAKASHQVIFTDLPGQPLRKLPEDLISASMPPAIVDLLEMIDINHQQQSGFAGACHTINFSLYDGAEVTAIGKPSQRVAQRQRAQPINKCLQVLGGGVFGKAGFTHACACHQAVSGGKAQISQKHGLMGRGGGHDER